MNLGTASMEILSQIEAWKDKMIWNPTHEKKILQGGYWQVGETDMTYETATMENLQDIYDVQKRGLGTQIMKTLETWIGETYDSVYLDASLPAAALYEKLGFRTVKHERYPVENGVVLVYEVMEKKLQMEG